MTCGRVGTIRSMSCSFLPTTWEKCRGVLQESSTEQGSLLMCPQNQLLNVDLIMQTFNDKRHTMNFNTTSAKCFFLAKYMILAWSLANPTTSHPIHYLKSLILLHKRYPAATRIEYMHTKPFWIQVEHETNNAHSTDSHHKSSSSTMETHKEESITRLVMLITNWVSQVQGVNEQHIQYLIRLLDEDHLLNLQGFGYSMGYGHPLIHASIQCLFYRNVAKILDRGPRHKEGE